MKLLLVFLTISFLINIYSRYLSINGKPNMQLYHIYTLLEYSFIIYVFSFWQYNAKLKYYFRYSILAFLAFWIVAKISIEDINQFDSISSSLELLLLLNASTYTLYHLFKRNSDELFQDYRFWVTVATLSYSAGNLVLFASSSIIILWAWVIIHSTNSIIMNALYIKGFLCQRDH